MEDEPAVGLPDIAALLGVALNDYGLVATNHFWPVLTNRDGIFVVGGGQGLVDPVQIPALAGRELRIWRLMYCPLSGLRFGQVVIVINDNKIVQMERLEKQRVSGIEGLFGEEI